MNLIKKHMGPDLVVVVRTAAELKKVLDGNPFCEGLRYLARIFVLFQRPPPAAAAERTCRAGFSRRRGSFDYEARGVLIIPGSAARSKLSQQLSRKEIGSGVDVAEL